MDWKLNTAQKAVLEWLCTSPDGPPPSETWKHAAWALQARELVSISRVGGKYTVKVTDIGRYMHQQGEYPVDSAGGRQTRRRRRIGTPSHGSSTAKPPGAAKPKLTTVTPPELSLELANKRFVRPHPAVRSLRDRPVALPAGPAARQRGLIAAELLVAAARNAGIDVTAHEQPQQRTPGKPYLGEPLVTLDTGHAEVGVRIGEYERQAEHVKTQEELERERRYGYSWSRRWDYVPTGLICLRLYARLGTPTRLVETANRPLHDFVPRVIHLVRLATEKEVKLEASHQEYRRREEERQAAARAQAERREHYGQWEKLLLEGAEAWERVRQLREFVSALEERSDPESAGFIAWSKSYISHLDPVENFETPGGGAPDLSHEEEKRLRSRPVPGLSDLWRTR